MTRPPPHLGVGPAGASLPPPDISYHSSPDSVDMSARPAKRTRNGGPSSPHSVQYISSTSPSPEPAGMPVTALTISTLTKPASHALLLELSTRLPKSKRTISSFLSNPANIAQPPQPKPLDFNNVAKNVARAMNSATSDWIRERREPYDVSGDIAGCLQDGITAILKGCEESSRMETRVNAIETICEMGGMAHDCDECVVEYFVEMDQEVLSEAAEKVVGMMLERGEDIAGVINELARHDDDYFGGVFTSLVEKHGGGDSD